MNEGFSTRQVLLGLGVWLTLAVIAGLRDVPASLQPPLPQVVLATLSVSLIAAGFLIPRLRSWAFSVDERLLVGLHLSRFVGAWFLVLQARGELPWAFAVPGGIGDIVVALLALVLIATLRAKEARGRAAYLAWNVVGFIDILLVVLTAARLGVEDPSSMAALFQFPLCLVPTWLVPVIIASHVFLFARLSRTPA